MRSTTITLSILSVLTLSLAAPVPATSDAVNAPAVGSAPAAGAVGAAGKMVKKVHQKVPSTKVYTQTGTSKSGKAVKAAKAHSLAKSTPVGKPLPPLRAPQSNAEKIARIKQLIVSLSIEPISAYNASIIEILTEKIASVQQTKINTDPRVASASVKTVAKLSTSTKSTKKVVAREIVTPATKKVTTPKKKKSLGAKMKKAATNLKKKVSKVVKAGVKKTSKKTNGKTAKTNGKAKKVKTAKAKKVKAASKAKVAPVVS